MELRDVVKGRRSIRKFLPKPVPDEMIKEIISDALWSPSWGNTQPWEVAILSGDAMKRFMEKNKEALMAGKKSNPDVPIPETWPEANNSRYKDVGRRVLESLSIARGDTEARMDYYGRMYACFEAPALIMLSVDKALSLEYAMLDVGIFVQSFCLLAFDKGLGTTILASSINYPDILRASFSFNKDKRVVIGIAMGWPDPEAPENSFERSRSKVEEFVQWIK
jgi:nitroreductase